MRDTIGAEHEFHDQDFAQGWAERFVPTPERLALFDAMRSELQSSVPANGRVVELGVGPGYLAEYLLRALPKIRYCGVDFSLPMLGLARERLAGHAERVGFVHADLLQEPWWDSVSGPVDAIVSTWSLHDLGGPQHTEAVYRACRFALVERGLLLNGDFIKPADTRYQYEPGRFEIATHLEMLHRVGFRSAQCLLVLEHELASPTAAQNYACLKALA